MDRTHSLFRIFLALLLLAVTAFVCVSLGNWQLDRAAQREAIKQSMEDGRRLPPLALTMDTRAEALSAWRPAGAKGHWRHDLTVLLENRNHDGRPGFWVATPLVLDGASDTALLVLRGWLARPLIASEPIPEIEQADGTQYVDGELRERVPRLLEIWSWSGQTTDLAGKLKSSTSGPPRAQNLDLADYSAATGLKFLPAVLTMQKVRSEDGLESDTRLLKEWAEPSIDSDKNRGYALQWFGFATIAGIAWLVIAWRALRRTRRHKHLKKDFL